MEKHILSKSTFIRGLQCAKSLYLYKNSIQLRDKVSPELKAVFNRGNKVGKLAQQLFPGGVEATPSHRTNKLVAVARTQELIENGTEVIYEAAFQHEQVLVILDLLVKNTANNFPDKTSWDDAWFAYEVKSSTKISKTYLLDASLQYWVITNSGLPLKDMSLVLIDNKYVRKGKVDLKHFFKIKSVKKEALQNQELVEENIVKSKGVAEGFMMPDVGIGEQCFSPYSCDFMGTCWRAAPKNSVFEITGMQKREQFELYNAGIKTIGEIPEKNNLNKNVNIHISAFKSQRPAIDKEAISMFLEKTVYPLFFMDFETFMPAIPVYEDTKPYQHIPFQYSLHYKKDKDAPLEHYSFLAEQGIDPRKAFLESLLKDTENTGTILVYDALMERNVLKGLQKDFPDYTAKIEDRLSRFVDLMTPFKNRSYYHPAMKNSHSIKNLLHALIPELSYKDLSISNGSLAMVAFENLQTETDMFKALEVRESLEAYCELDTLSMVKVFEVLESV